MKIYVASSWRNEYYPDVVKALRAAGHEVYDFRNPPSGGHGFKWSDIDQNYMEWEPDDFREHLKNHPLAQAQLKNDLEALKSCDACVLVLPCGRSAHTEAGWMAGTGKKVIVYIPCRQEPELMYGLFDAVCCSMVEVVCTLNSISVKQYDRADYKLINDLRSSRVNCNKKGYYDSYKDNVYGGKMEEHFQDMFDDGSGGELHSKAEAVHSSSMLSFNLFHWIKGSKFEYEGGVYDEVFFEIKLKTIRKSNAPANMDVVLKGTKDGCKHFLFIESKFTEYYKDTPFGISQAYLDSSRYFSNIDWVEILTTTKDWIKNHKFYKDGIKQAITHLIGINNLAEQECLDSFNTYCRDKGLNLRIDNLEQIEFVNLVFEPNKEKYKAEHDAYVDYMDMYNEFCKGLPSSLKVKPKNVSYSVIWNTMKPQIHDKELVSFIQNRYMVFSEKYMTSSEQ